MRKILAGFFALSIGLLTAVPAFAEEVQIAKVYRDYPGYINPAVCENPNLDKPAAGKPVVPQQPAEPSQPAQSVAPVVAPAAPAAEKPAVVPAVVPVAPAASAAPSAAPATVSPAPAISNSPVSPAQPSTPAVTARKCSQAAGQEASHDFVTGHYVSIWGGVVATRDIELSHTVDMSLDHGYAAGLAVGYDFGPIRLEVEGSHRDSDGDELKTSSGDINARSDLTVDAILAVGYADFATGGPLTPYLGAGAGYARAELDDSDANDDVGVAQLAAGVQFAVTSRVAVDLGYKYLFPVSHSDFDVEQHTAMLGLQIRF